MLGAVVFELVAAGEVEEGLAGLGDGGEEEAELGELGGAAAVFEGVEVAGLGAGAGAAAASAAPRLGVGGAGFGLGFEGHGSPPSSG